MEYVQIETMEDSLNQSISVTFKIGEASKRVRFEFVYSEETDRWYVSMYDLQLDQMYFSMIPLLASYGDVWNDLLVPYRYMYIGQLFCVPKTDNPTTENPSKDNLNEFYIIWGDGLG